MIPASENCRGVKGLHDCGLESVAYKWGESRVIEEVSVFSEIVLLGSSSQRYLSLKVANASCVLKPKFLTSACDC